MAWYSNMKDFKKSGAGKAYLGTYDYANITGLQNPDKPSTKGEEAARQAALEALQNANPKAFEEYQSAGDFNPELLGELPQLQDSRLSNIQTDPRLMSAQMQALQELQNIGADGFTSADKAAIGAGMDQAAQQERSQRDAILANQASRGMGGSGSELAAQLANQQGSAMRNSQVGAEMGLAGRQRALQAMMESGNLAGNMQGQQFDQQARIAQAQDAVNRFNTQTKIGQQEANNRMMNEARAGNLSNKQEIMNKNTSGKNGFRQDAFNNQNTVSGKWYDHATNEANRKMGDYQGEVDAQAAKTNGFFNAAGSIIGGMYGNPQMGQQVGGAMGGAVSSDSKKKPGAF